MRIAHTFCISLLLVIAIPWKGMAQNSGLRASFRMNNVSLQASLDSLMKWYPVSIVYLDRNVEGKSVSVSCTDCTLDQALSGVLTGTSLTWIGIGNQVILKGREIQPARPVATISGTVTDSLRGESIAGASVLLQDSVDQPYATVRRWCPTNSYGFFSLPNVSPGNYAVVVRALGYHTGKVAVHVAADVPVRVAVGMVQEEIMLQEVTVEGQRTALASAQGISRGIYIRSTPSDQNNYLLDEARIYNPSHFGGVLSPFNAEVLNDVQVVIGGLPPSYGGYVGGIVDLSMRDGSLERLAGSAGTGLQASQLSLEGPINASTTFLLSGRRGYPDIGVPLLKTEAERSHQKSSELVAKLAHRLSPGSQLSLSGYLAADSYSNEARGTGQRLTNDFSWSNTALNFRWIGIVSPSLFLHSSAVYTRYHFALDHSLADESFPQMGTQLSSLYTIEDVSVQARAESYYDEEHTVRAGVELTHHTISGDISEFSTQIAPLSLNDFSSWEASVYLQDQWRILPRVTAELGGRATSFVGSKGTFSAVDPRFSLLFAPDEYTRFYGSLTAINQFIHPYRKSGVFLLYPTIFWYPSTDKVRPSTALQVSVGVEKGLSDNAFVVSAESYYRMTDNLHEFGLDTTISAQKDLNNVILFGTGKVYGVGCSLRKRTGDLTGAISYNLSWVRETFAEVNEGKPFAPPLDRRHEVQIALRYDAGRGWVFGALCVLASDQSSSFAPKIIQLKSRDSGPGLVTNPAEAEFVDVNGSRLPGFQRLELNVLYRFSSWDLPCQISLRLLNAYGLLDPFTWELQSKSDLRLKWRATLRDLDILPLYPTLGFLVRF